MRHIHEGFVVLSILVGVEQKKKTILKAFRKKLQLWSIGSICYDDTVVIKVIFQARHRWGNKHYLASCEQWEKVHFVGWLHLLLSRRENNSSLNQKSFKRFLSVFSAETSLPGETKDVGCLMSEALLSCSMFHSNRIYIQFSTRPGNLQRKVSWPWTNTVHFTPKPNLSFFMYKTSQSLSPKA